jgi:predicted RNase H-like HicB family nuclease
MPDVEQARNPAIGTLCAIVFFVPPASLFPMWTKSEALFFFVLVCDTMKQMKSIIQFHLYKSEKFYVAEGIDLPVVTQGKTLDELAENIREAVALQLEGENLEEFDLSPKPTILANFELSALANA